MSTRDFVAGGLLVAGGGGLLAALFWPKGEPEREMSPARASTEPASTGRKMVDAILDKLRAASQSSGVPLGLLVGWVAKESGGKLASTTSLDERGYFQLMPDESKRLRLDHQRLSTDSDYSIDGGVRLVQDYAKRATDIGIARAGTEYFWRLVKLLHTMGSGAVKAIVADAKKVGATGSWADLERYALDNDAAILHETRHSPKKWFPLVDQVYAIGQPFGFGTPDGAPVLVTGDESAHSIGITILGGMTAPPIAPRATVIGFDSGPSRPVTSDADRESLARMLATNGRSCTDRELRAMAWAARNRAVRLGVPVRDVFVDGFASARMPATERALAVAADVLAASDMTDPTHGAVDFWRPDLMEIVGALVAAGRLSGYATTEEDAEEELARRGLRVLGTIGRVELLGAA